MQCGTVFLVRERIQENKNSSQKEFIAGGLEGLQMFTIRLTPDSSKATIIPSTQIFFQGQNILKFIEYAPQNLLVVLAINAQQQKIYHLELETSQQSEIGSLFLKRSISNELFKIEQMPLVLFKTDKQFYVINVE